MTQASKTALNFFTAYLTRFSHIVGVVLCLLSGLNASAQEDEYYAKNYFRGNGKDILDGPNTEAVTDPDVVLDRELIVHTTLFVLSRPRGARMWAYANSEGRVRLLLDTDLSRESETEAAAPQTTRFFDSTFPKYWAHLTWRATFEKGADDSLTSANLLPSFMRFYAPNPLGTTTTGINPYGRDDEYVPHGEWGFRIYVRSGASPFIDRLQFDSEYNISGITSLDGAGLKFTAKGTLAGKVVPEGPLNFRSYVSSEEEQLDEGYVPPATYRLEIEEYNIPLDLSHIKKGEQYTVVYYLNLSGGTYTDQFIWNYIADPLDPAGPDSGIVLETTDLPADTPVRQCTELFDENRYLDHQDGTATDNYTGLMWQRCPVNYTLDDNGTPDAFADDSCAPDAATDISHGWQEALTLSVADASAAQDDWRLPNVKELESLVAACFSPTIEPELFPNTPQDLGFWSSTSGRYVWQQFINPADIAADAWQVEFSNGDLQTTDKSKLAYSRLVRDTGALPIAPLPALSAGRASVDEGDSGSTVLQIPVGLSKSATANVTVDYSVTAPNNNAINGVDFDETTDTLTFLPGELRKEVPVTVYGNIDPSNNKTLYLDLSMASSNSRITMPTGVGIILDDDPIVSLGSNAVQEYEGNSARPPSTIKVPVFLDRNAAQQISVDYQLVQGTAEFSDVNGLINGTVTFNVGEKVTYVDIEPVNDDVYENDETLILEISNPVGAKLEPGFGDTLQRTVVLINDDGPGTYSVLNDTGVTTCANDTDNAVDCPQAGFASQDAEQGRDADPTRNDPSDGDAGFSFTKIDATGAGLPDDASTWSCANDNITGLIWEVKTANISSPIENNDLHSSRWTYSWFNSTGINNGGYAGVQNAGVCFDAFSCDTEKFIAAVNAEALCGYTDWRLPTVEELYSIVDMTGDFSAQLTLADGPDGSTGYFRYPQLGNGTGPWTSSTAAGRDGGTNAWYLSDSGMNKKDKGVLRTTPLPVRLVRGGIVQLP